MSPAPLTRPQPSALALTRAALSPQPGTRCSPSLIKPRVSSPSRSQCLLSIKTFKSLPAMKVKTITTPTKIYLILRRPNGPLSRQDRSTIGARDSTFMP